MSADRLQKLVTKCLDASIANITQSHRERLRLSRQTAIDRHIQSREAKFAGVAGIFHVDFFARRALIRFGAVLLLAIGVAYWHAQVYVVDLEEVDSAILIDEMPMDVITDKGFDAWLRSPAAR